MAINYWDMDDDEEITGEYVNESGGDFPIIPHGTRVSCFIDEAKLDHKAAWDKGVENSFTEDCIKLRFEIDEPEDYARQKLFKTFWTETGTDEKLKRDRTLFLNIDKNAGGNLAKLRRQATDEELQRYLVCKKMTIVVGMMNDKKNNKQINYVMGVGSAIGDITAPSKQTQNAKKASLFDDVDDDIPF